MPWTGVARRTIDGVPVLRALVKSPAGQHLVNTTRGARVVRERLRFATRQFGPTRMRSYRLRESGLTVFLRHRTRDIDVLNELFGGTGGRLIYDPPAAVASMLDANPAPTVLDLGANIGLFGVYMLSRWPRARIRSFEPDPTNLPLVTNTIAANGAQRRWSVANMAVANKTTEAHFTAGLFADSHLSLEADAGAVQPSLTDRDGGGHTITVRTVDIFAEDHDVDLMKMDIEGSEWAILGDERLASLKADILVFEWHVGGCPEPDPPSHATQLLRAAGYDGIKDVVNGGEAGTLWAWRAPAGHASSNGA